MIRRMIASMTVAALLLMSIGTASAQSCPEGFTEEDCTLFETAVANTSSATSFNLEFSQLTSINMGIAITISAEGSGTFILDGAGNITAARLDMPAVSQDTGFFDASEGAASFVFVDNVLYFGAGDSLETLEWKSVEAESVNNIDLTFLGLINTASNSLDMTTDLPAVTEWTRDDNATTSDGTSAISFSGSVVDAEMMEGVDASMTGGMGGTYTINTVFLIDGENQLLLEYSNNSTLSMDMGNIMDEAMEGEDTEGMEDLFGDSMGSFSGDSTVTARFSNYNADLSGEVVAPEGALPMEQYLIDTINFSFGGLPTVLTDYYSALASESMAANFGGFGGEFAMSDYFGNCTAEYYTLNEAGSIAIGDTLNENLGADTADTYSLELTAGETVTITMTSDPLDTYLELLDPDGVGVYSDDDSGGGFNSQIIYTPEATGPFTVVACTYSGGEGGAYTLSVSN
jgi:hypothetical protein